MWKNGKEGDAEGDESWKEKRGRRETIEAEEKNGAKEKGGMRHRCKGHRADIWQRYEAKHCSSLCSQSEGGEYCGGQALKIQQSNAPERWSCSLRVRGPHFASKVSYNAGAATDDCAGLCKSPLRGRYR